MKKDELMSLVGKWVKVYFKDGDTATGKLGFTSEFSGWFDYRKPNYFTVNNWDFKVSHIKKVEVIYGNKY